MRSHPTFPYLRAIASLACQRRQSPWCHQRGMGRGAHFGDEALGDVVKRKGGDFRMEEYLEEDIAQFFEHLAFRFAVAHGRGEFGRLLLKIGQERGMGLLALPLPMRRAVAMVWRACMMGSARDSARMTDSPLARRARVSGSCSSVLTKVPVASSPTSRSEKFHRTDTGTSPVKWTGPRSFPCACMGIMVGQRSSSNSTVMCTKSSPSSHYGAIQGILGQ